MEVWALKHGATYTLRWPPIKSDDVDGRLQPGFDDSWRKMSLWLVFQDILCFNKELKSLAMLRYMEKLADDMGNELKKLLK